MGGEHRNVKYKIIDDSGFVVANGENLQLEFSSVKDCREWIKEFGDPGVPLCPAKIWPAVTVKEEVQRRLV